MKSKWTEKEKKKKKNQFVQSLKSVLFLFLVMCIVNHEIFVLFTRSALTFGFLISNVMTYIEVSLSLTNLKEFKPKTS